MVLDLSLLPFCTFTVRLTFAEIALRGIVRREWEPRRSLTVKTEQGSAAESSIHLSHCFRMLSVRSAHNSTPCLMDPAPQPHFSDVELSGVLQGTGSCPRVYKRARDSSLDAVTRPSPGFGDELAGATKEEYGEKSELATGYRQT